MIATIKNRKLPIVAAVIFFMCLSLAACAPQVASGSSEGEESEDTITQIDFTFSMESDCAICHTEESEASSNEECVMGNPNHTDLTCVTCHDDESGLTTVHEGVVYGDDLPKRLTDTSVDSEICLTCHDSDELAEITADCTVLTDNYGTVANPHTVSSLNDMHAESIDCLSCHAAHSDTTVEEESQDFCTSCHHVGVYQCYTCHD